MTRRIMLHKNTLLCAGLGAVFLFAQVPLASAAVVTSMKPLGFIAAAIADGVTETQVLLPDGASEHDYSLRPSDVKRLQNADLVVWIGPEMEAFMDKSTQSIAAKKYSRPFNKPGLTNFSNLGHTRVVKRFFVPSKFTGQAVRV